MVGSKNILAELTEQFLPQMTPSERREALESLQRIIDAEFFKLAEEEAGRLDIACPHCGSTDFVKRGKDSLGKQRYKCCDCGRSFGGGAWKIFGTTKLSRDQWMRFAECHIDRLSLRNSAERELELACHNAFDAGNHEINRINNVHSQLEGFMGGFYGVSSRRLENYLTWFKREHSFKNGRTSQEMSELVVKQAVQGTYDTVWREHKNTPYPFWEYWAAVAG